MSDYQQGHEQGHSLPSETPDAILVVEGDQIGSTIIDSVLQNAGYRPEWAGGGRMGLEKAADIRPDLIILDVVLPDMDGLEVCRRLRADDECRCTPVILITGDTDDHTLQTLFEAGGSDYVRKPISRVELLARVRAALAQRRSARMSMEEEKLKGILATAGGICHELNQPLQYVLGAVQLLMMDIPKDDFVYAHLDAIRARIEQMGEITRRLTVISRFRKRKDVGDPDILDIDGSISNGG